MFCQLSEQEFELLCSGVHPFETTLYLNLRRFADFKTGLFSHRSTKKVNLSYLATLLNRESSQGKAELKFCHTDIRRFLDNLVKHGLVADICREGRSLKMRLPLLGSIRKEEQPTEAKKVVFPTVEAKAAIEVEEVVHSSAGISDMKLTEIAAPKTAECPVNTASSLVVDEPEIGMLSEDEDGTDWMLSNEKSDKPAETLAGQRFAGDSESSFSTIEPSHVLKNQNLERTRERETLPSAKENQTQTRQVQSETHHAASRLAGKTERDEGESHGVALPHDEWIFPSLLRKISGKSILYTFSEQSRAIYHGWKLCGFTLDDIERAFYKVITRKMKITADSVDTVLRKPAQSSKGKGAWQKPVDPTKGRLVL